MKIDSKKHIRPLRLKGLPTDFRDQIKQARARRGWGQRQFGAVVGLPQSHILAIESGETVPRLTLCWIWCAFLIWIFCSCRVPSYQLCSPSSEPTRSRSQKRSHFTRQTKMSPIPVKKAAMNFDPHTLNALEVSLHGRRIGVINRISGDRFLFSFEQDYIEDANRPTLSLSFKGQAGGLVIPTRTVTGRLPVFFSNLLPEGHLREYLAARAGVKQHREFFLLAVLGADLPGALTVTPIDQPAQSSVEHTSDRDSRDRPNTALRFSLAGVQLKFSAIMEASGGLTIPADGIGGSWLVKLPSSRFPSVPENEYAMMALARAVGIEVPRTELIIGELSGLPVDAVPIDRKALAVQRFDRGEKGKTIHMEDFAQVFGLYPQDKYHHRSYANIASVLWAETGETSTYEFFRRLVFSVLIGNGDMHLKNWSLLLFGWPHTGVVACLRPCRYLSLYSER